jgi:ankyrin repeat protein
MRAAQGGPTTINEGHVAIARLLLAKGADVDVKSKNGVTALSVAASHAHTEVVQLLQRAGARR